MFINQFEKTAKLYGVFNSKDNTGQFLTCVCRLQFLAELVKHHILVPLAVQQLINQTFCWISPILLYLPQTSSPPQHTHQISAIIGLIIIEESNRVTSMYLAIHVPSDDTHTEHRVSGEFTSLLNWNCLYAIVSSTLINRNQVVSLQLASPAVLHISKAKKCKRTKSNFSKFR